MVPYSPRASQSTAARSNIIANKPRPPACWTSLLSFVGQSKKHQLPFVSNLPSSVTISLKWWIRPTR